MTSFIVLCSLIAIVPRPKYNIAPLRSMAIPFRCVHVRCQQKPTPYEWTLTGTPAVVWRNVLHDPDDIWATNGLFGNPCRRYRRLQLAIGILQMAHLIKLPLPRKISYELCWAERCTSTCVPFPRICTKNSRRLVPHARGIYSSATLLLRR